MADATETQNTDWEKQYKQLQRKYNRKDKEIGELKSVKSDGARMEKDLEGIFALFARQNPDFQEDIESYLRSRTAQRGYDERRADAQTRLADMVEDKDVEWNDPRLTDARIKFAEAEASANSSGFDEALRLAESALATPAYSPATALEERGEEVPQSDQEREDEIQRRVEETLRDKYRVDVDGSNSQSQPRLTYGDLRDLDSQESSNANLKDKFTQAWNQIYKNE